MLNLSKRVSQVICVYMNDIEQSNTKHGYVLKNITL